MYADDLTDAPTHHKTRRIIMLNRNKIHRVLSFALVVVLTFCVAFLPSGMDGTAFAVDGHISTEVINFDSNADAFAYSIAPTHKNRQSINS